jgi:hypothetical protein
MRRLTFLLVVVSICGCGSPMPALGTIGPPESGWSSAGKRADCTAPDVSPRLHFARVSDLSWMSASERVLLATPDLSRTAGADVQALERFAIDSAMRRIAPLGLDAAGAAVIAARFRRAPEIRTRDDLARALEMVRESARELPEGVRGHHVLAVLERGMREALENGFPDVRCAYIVGHGTIESEVAAAAIEAGAPRSRVAEVSVDLLSQMAELARSETASIG